MSVSWLVLRRFTSLLCKVESRGDLKIPTGLPREMRTFLMLVHFISLEMSLVISSKCSHIFNQSHMMTVLPNTHLSTKVQICDPDQGGKKTLSLEWLMKAVTRTSQLCLNFSSYSWKSLHSWWYAMCYRKYKIICRNMAYTLLMAFCPWQLMRHVSVHYLLCVREILTVMIKLICSE